MENKAQAAMENFLEGYNCAQAVLRAYAREAGLTEETALLLGSSLGGGMGRLREICGALSAAFLVLGMKAGYTSPGDDKAKGAHYARIQALAARFKEENGSLLCRDLLAMGQGADSPVPSPRTEQYYKERPCARIVYSAAALLEGQEGPEQEKG